jgi:D-aminopeptidase
MIAGDQVAAEQLRALVPNVEVVIVKTAISNLAGNCIPPRRSREMIRAGAERAVTRAVAEEFKPYTGETTPYQIEITLKNDMVEGLRRNLEMMPEFEIVDARAVRTQADDMDMGFRRIAYLTFGQAPGLQRY